MLSRSVAVRVMVVVPAARGVRVRSVPARVTLAVEGWEEAAVRASGGMAVAALMMTRLSGL